MAEQGGGGRGGDASDKAREEFFSEAQEIVEGLSRDLLALDEVCRDLGLARLAGEGEDAMPGESAPGGIRGLRLGQPGWNRSAHRSDGVAQIDLNPPAARQAQEQQVAAEGEGWFAKLRVSDPAQLDELMDKTAYAAFVATL